MFYLGSNDGSLEIPCNIFEEMKILKLLDLTGLCIPSIPSSLQFLTNLQTLCLDRCELGDIALVTRKSLAFLDLSLNRCRKK